MDIIRIGEKIISRRKIGQLVGDILELRSDGMSQTEVAHRLGIDRTLVCRLENLGEIRKGRSIAVVGFPVKNKEELQDVLIKEGVDFVFLMTEAERWEFVRQKSGIDLLNSIMELITLAHSFDQVVVIGSNKRIKIFEAALDKNVVGFEIGESPIQEDKYVNPQEIVSLVRAVKQ